MQLKTYFRDKHKTDQGSLWFTHLSFNLSHYLESFNILTRPCSESYRYNHRHMFLVISTKNCPAPYSRAQTTATRTSTLPHQSPWKVVLMNPSFKHHNTTMHHSINNQQATSLGLFQRLVGQCQFCKPNTSLSGHTANWLLPFNFVDPSSPAVNCACTNNSLEATWLCAITERSFKSSHNAGMRRDLTISLTFANDIPCPDPQGYSGWTAFWWPQEHGWSEYSTMLQTSSVSSMLTISCSRTSFLESNGIYLQEWILYIQDTWKRNTSLLIQPNILYLLYHTLVKTVISKPTESGQHAEKSVHEREFM